MNPVNTWFSPLVAVTTASVLWTTPTLANENTSLATLDYFQGRESIEIKVIPPPENNRGGTCQAFLAPSMSAIMGNHPNNWGILVESLATGEVIYSHNANRYFIPASNTKLFTTAAALQRLDPNGLIRSKSVREWINVTNQRSNNWYADTLLRYIGGANAVKATLAQLGINPDGYRLADGSGLSRSNLATPQVIVQLLRAMYYSPRRDLFYSSLPVAGYSGTLSNRMRQTPAQGAVNAKTGTLRGVRTLSGYIHHPQYGMLLFSILANNPHQSGNAIVSAIDRMVLQLSTVTPCSASSSF